VARARLHDCEDRDLIASILAICVGASLGAILRWRLAARFNAVVPALPLGTLLANLLGGYLVGLALAFIAQNPTLSPEWRLFFVTGFLGSLTTFSTFSAEVVTSLVQGRLQWAIATVALHVLGSVAMTVLGIGTIALLRARDLPGG
jgi:CrcB protein